MSLNSISRKFGPGLLYAAAAIGVSHLVQSTRAGAQFGFELLWVVILANILKYPFFRIGPAYTALTGNSLLTGYKKIGNWTIILFFCMTLATMFTVQSAVTVVTAGLLNQFLDINLDVRHTSTIILAISAVLLSIGRYNLLDNFIKIIIVILTITTLVTISFALFAQFPKVVAPINFDFTNKGHLFFFIALVGWMPAPMDVPIWHGLWAMAKNKDQKEKTSLKDAMMDFNVGFITTAFLACCFLSLGALVMYRSGIELSSSATVFAGQLVELYTTSLGSWSYPIISIAAFTTMLSTTLTCLDAFARILKEALFVYNNQDSYKDSKWYNVWLIITFIGSCIIFYTYLENMKNLVDLATTLSFIVAPIYAILNYKVINSNQIPQEHRLSGTLRLTALVGIAYFSGFTLYYLYLKF